MDSVLSVLVTTISAMDIIEVLMYFAAHLRGDKLQQPESGGGDLETLKSNLKETIAQTPVPKNSLLTCAQDGTLFKDQYRVDTEIDAQKLDEINRRVDDLANRMSDSSKSNGNVTQSDKDNDDKRTSDQNNNFTCIPDKNKNAADVAKVEILAQDDVTKVREKENELLASFNAIKTENIDQSIPSTSEILIDTEKCEVNETPSLDSCYESLTTSNVIDSNRLRPLTREDEFRHTIKKRSSVSSTSSHDSRIEELQVLTSLEQEEQQHIDEYMPIIYPGSPLIDVLADSIETDNEPELETIIEVHSSSPDEPMVEEEGTSKNRFAFDKSPVPNIGVQMSLPWGDVKQEKESKSREVFSRAKSASIEESEVEEAIDTAQETKKWIDNCETEAIKEEFEPKDEFEPKEQFELKEPLEPKDQFEAKEQFEPKDQFESKEKFEPKEQFESKEKFEPKEQFEPKEPLEPKEEAGEPVMTVIRKKSLKSEKNTNESLIQQQLEQQVTELKDTVQDTARQIPVDEPVIIQKRINLIGVQSSTTDTNNNEHDDNPRESPTVRRRLNTQKKTLAFRDSEDYEDSEEASLLHSIKDDRLELDVDNQYIDDPQIKEMASYVQKLTKARVASMEEEDDDEVEEEYYWKPEKHETRRRSMAEVLIIPKSDDKRFTEEVAQNLALNREALEYQEHWQLENLKVDETIFNKQHFNSPRASGYRSKSHSIAYESSKFAGHRRDSLAELMIIPKTVKESCESCDHLIQQLENEALEYQQVWGIDIPRLKEQKRNRSQSISIAQLARRRETLEVDIRRDSIAELLIVPRTVRESIDESVLMQLENEALAYQFAWNLNPEEVGKRSKNRSMSISMGVLSRKKRARPSISRRRQSLAEAIIVPKDHAGMVVDDPHLLSLLENEAYEYKQAFGLRTPEIMESFCEEEHEERQPDYNEWFHRFDDQTTSHIETSSFTDDEDEEVSDLLKNASGEIQVQNHIFYTFSKGKTPPSKSATPDTVIKAPLRPTTPADYDNYMQKFPDQLSPEIEMNDGRKSPANLETYLAQNKLSPIPSPKAVTPEPSLAPPSMETYLERMRSASPQPAPVPPPSIEIETSATPVIQPTLIHSPRALTPLRPMQHPPSLETYLERLRSQSPQVETEY